MVKRRLIPKLQLKSIKFGSTNKMVLVTTVNFDKTINAGDPVSQAKIYEAQSADELIFVDIDSNSYNRQLVIEIIRKVSEEIFMPITIGGGIGNINDFREFLNNGADKISINTNAVLDKSLITNTSKKFGAQCVVVSIDFKKDIDGKYYVWIKGGKEKTSLHPVDWAIEAERLGAGEILITSIDKDGTSSGLDLEIINSIATKVRIPVIASGGCGLASHFIDGFRNGADAVSAGTFFCFKDQSPIQTRSHIKNAGIPIRLHR